MMKDDAQPPQTVDGYFSALPLDTRAALEHLRSTIRAAAPEATERIAYLMPCFCLGSKPLVCYAAFTNHLSFFGTRPETQEQFEAEMTGYETSKGTIRFTVDHPLPDDLISRIVKARVADIDANRG